MKNRADIYITGKYPRVLELKLTSHVSKLITHLPLYHLFPELRKIEFNSEKFLENNPRIEKDLLIMKLH